MHTVCPHTLHTVHCTQSHTRHGESTATETATPPGFTKNDLIYTLKTEFSRARDAHTAREKKLHSDTFTDYGSLAAARRLAVDAAARSATGLWAVLEATTCARLPERVGVCEEAE